MVERIGVEEYQLWIAIVKELRSLGIEINDQDKLCQSIKDWGMAYAKLIMKCPKILTDSSLQR
jgi:hypothetical protein